ncbi:heterokaryon incompatibility protein-domain-containing protein [Pisolithus marmoratus]|nr:heterokaryon incompatibility protein-domain-containing protein [Pisolithus marmoratus]
MQMFARTLRLVGLNGGPKQTPAILPTDIVVLTESTSIFMSILLQDVNVQAIGDQIPGPAEVNAQRCRFEGMRSDIVIVDAPSFYTHLIPDGKEVLKRWMDSNYTMPCKAAGVLYMHNLVFNSRDADLKVGKHLCAFQRICRQALIPSVTHIVPTLYRRGRLSDERINTLATQLQLQAGAQFFDEQPETAWDILQGLLSRWRITLTKPKTKTSDLKAKLLLEVKRVFFEMVEKYPPRLFHTPTGLLCNRDAQLSHFERSPPYKRLLLPSAPPRSDQELETEINSVISEFFGFAMLSHRWGSGEPLLRDVEGKKIYELGNTDGLQKLKRFCNLARQRNFLWAWSDTCCIDKDSSAELQEAIGSMFSWYRRSSLTIVYLSDVSGTVSFAESDWFKRGWTLQELLASQTVLFYARDWSLYMNRHTPNHKKDPALLTELQNATRIARQHLEGFYPGMDDARSRLHWASGRRTTRPEDIAYSLFGIFQVHLPVLYGEQTENALGRLLVEIISRSGDVSVLDWIGEVSPFNSCFPANLKPYQKVPHIQHIPSDPAIRDGLRFDKARKLYSDLAWLPLARCVNRRLVLPATIHPVESIGSRGSSTSSSHYDCEIHASRLRPINVTLSVKLDEDADSYILARPWHPKLLGLQANSDADVVWKSLEQLQQPFNALLLKKLRHNEYKRIACDCMITAQVQDLASVLESEVLVPEIV